MGSPPPENFPPPAAASSGDSFAAPAATAGTCGISLAPPRFVFGVSLALPFAFPPKPPSLNLSFKLSCDPTNPVDVSGGLAWGAGRESNVPPDPDDTEDDPTF